MTKGYQDRCPVCDRVFYNSGLYDVCPACERELDACKYEGDPQYHKMGVWEDAEGNEAEEVDAGMLDVAVEDFSEELVEVMDSNAYCAEFEFMFGYKGAMDVAYSQRRM